MTETTLLNLPYIMPSQAQKHITHNDTLRILDVIVHMRVLGRNAETPPEVPNEGDRWLVGPEPSGEFDGQVGRIACFQDGAWAFFTPRDGWLAWDGEALLVFDGVGWTDVSGAEMRDLVGVNTSADEINRLAVSAPATLLTHDGQGHQVKINKATAADTGSLMFQTGWSGRAELGLAGDDDFRIKLSEDGDQWKTVLRASVDETQLFGNVAVAAESAPFLLTLGDADPNAVPVAHPDKTSMLTGAGAAYYRGRDSANGIEFLMGTSTAGYVLLAAMSNHPFVIRVNNSVEAIRIATSGQVGITAPAPHPSAQLQVGGTTRGFLPPRLTDAQRNSIASPAEGLTIYNLTSHEPQFWNGSTWVGMAAG